jgi:hypothetical protein
MNDVVLMADERLFRARKIDPKGRCHGRKPIRYKRNGGPHLFCIRCNRAYNVDTGEQIPNWAYTEVKPGYFKVAHVHMIEKARS